MLLSRFDIDKELENMDKKEDMDKKEELKSELSNGKSSIKIQPVPTKGKTSMYGTHALFFRGALSLQQ